MRKAKQSTAKNVMVLMVDSTDHVTGKASLTLTITSSKDGAAFASISPTVTERGNGWYNLALTSAHTDTLGDLALHITGTAADPADIVLLVEAGATDADVSSRLATAGYTAPLDAAGTRSAVGLASANLDTQITQIIGYVDEIETRLTAVRAGLLDNLANLDAAVSSRLATAGYTAPDNAGITANGSAIAALNDITVADILAGAAAAPIAANIKKVNDIVIDGNGQTGTEWGPA